jgi:hypothetical protein
MGSQGLLQEPERRSYTAADRKRYLAGREARLALYARLRAEQDAQRNDEKGRSRWT